MIINMCPKMIMPSKILTIVLNAPHMVGCAKISWTSEQIPLERIGVLDAVSVIYIMNLIDREYLYQSLVKNDKVYRFIIGRERFSGKG